MRRRIRSCGLERERERVVVALDLGPDLLAESSRSYAGVSFIAGDARRLPFADDSFDAVGALQTIEHLAETDQFLAEIARVLRPGGLAYLTTPNIDRLPPTAAKEFNPHHLRDFTPQDLGAELERHFASVQLYGQVQDPGLERTRALVRAAEKEWAFTGRVAGVERIVRRLPGPVRVPLRRALLRIVGVPEWPLREAEAARRAVRVEDFMLAQPAEVSGCTVAVVTEPRKPRRARDAT